MSVKVRLPLTLAIMDGMSVGVGDESTSCRCRSVVESFQVQPGHDQDHRRQRPRGRGARRVHAGDRPGAVFDVPRFDFEHVSNIMVVVEAEGGRVALLVDELLGQQQVVVKNLESQLPQGRRRVGRHHHGRRPRGADPGRRHAWCAARATEPRTPDRHEPACSAAARLHASARRMLGAIAMVLGTVRPGRRRRPARRALTLEPAERRVRLHHSLARAAAASPRLRTRIAAPCAAREGHGRSTTRTAMPLIKHREQWTAAIADHAQVARGAARRRGGRRQPDRPRGDHAAARPTSSASQPVLQQIQNGGYDNARVADKMLARAKAHVAAVEAGIAADRHASSAPRPQATAGRVRRPAMQTVLSCSSACWRSCWSLVVPLTLLNSRSITPPDQQARDGWPRPSPPAT